MAYESLVADRSLAHAPNIPEDKQLEILRLAAEGLPIHKITQVVGLSWQTIARYTLRDPLFEQKWSTARRFGADLIADELYTMYDGAETVADAMIARGKSDNIKTIAAWRNPSKYGPKLNVDVTHSIDLSKALQQAEGRTIPILEQAQIDRAAAISVSGAPIVTGPPAKSDNTPFELESSGIDAMQELPPVDKVAPAMQHSGRLSSNQSGGASSPQSYPLVDKSGHQVIDAEVIGTVGNSQSIAGDFEQFL